MGTKVIAGIIGSAVGGLVGAIVWAMVAYYAHMEIGWIAWGIGILAGLGMGLIVKEQGGFVSGAVAAVIALVSICGGKYACVSMIAEKELAKIKQDQSFQVTEKDAQHFMAAQLIQEAEEAGKKLNWPGGAEPEDGWEDETQLPPDIWKDVQDRWKALDQPARDSYIAAVQRQREQFTDKLAEDVKAEGFLATFGLFDILFAVLAIGSAFKLGTGNLSAGGDE